MGWVVYNTVDGRAKRYYKKAGVAKAQATKLNRDPYASHHGFAQFEAISYADYEGVLMGMGEPERKLWAFCRG